MVGLNLLGFIKIQILLVRFKEKLITLTLYYQPKWTYFLLLSYVPKMVCIKIKRKETFSFSLRILMKGSVDDFKGIF